MQNGLLEQTEHMVSHYSAKREKNVPGPVLSRKTGIGSSSHDGDTRSGQTRKKPKDLSVCDREERMLCTYDSEELEHGIGAGVNCLGHGLRSVQLRDVFYYESIKRELQKTYI
jgi:hypothetical protein